MSERKEESEHVYIWTGTLIQCESTQMMCMCVFVEEVVINVIEPVGCVCV